MGTLISERHDSVLRRVVHAIRQGKYRNWELLVDRKVSQDSEKRPDILLKSPTEKVAVISDVCIPFELGTSAFEAAENRKIEKYEHIAKGLRGEGYRVLSLPIVVGSLGSWKPESCAALSKLGIPRSVISKMVLQIQASVIEYSKNIFWKHIYGDDYKIIDSPLTSAEPEPPPLFTSSEEM